MHYCLKTSTSKEQAATTATLPQGPQVRTLTPHRAFTPGPKVTVKIKEVIQAHHLLLVKLLQTQTRPNLLLKTLLQTLRDSLTAFSLRLETSSSLSFTTCAVSAVAAL